MRRTPYDGDAWTRWFFGLITFVVILWAFSHDLHKELTQFHQDLKPSPAPAHACRPPKCRIVRGSPTSSPRAARSRPLVAPTLSVTAYCWTGHRTASGAWPAVGMAAGNSWPPGTQLAVEAWGVVTVTDRIGHGSQLDLYLGREGCEQKARSFGRQSLRVHVI
jgi:3D (Asp-Asp-Asp) domain-containing protein